MKKNTLYLFLSLLSGILLSFSFPNFIEKTADVHTLFFMWFAFVPLIYVVIKEEKMSNVFLYCLGSTGIFYLISLYWLCNVAPMGPGAYPACFILCGYFAALYAASFAAVKYMNKRTGMDYIFSIPVILTFSEFAREWLFSGCPVLTPAQSQYRFIPLLQVLSITGAAGLNFIIFSVNGLIASFAAGRVFKYRKTENTVWIIIFISLLSAAAAANLYTGRGTKTLKAAVIQPNIDQNVSWTPEYRKYTMDTMKALYKSVELEKPDIIVWPETGYPGVLNLEINKPEIGSWFKGVFAIVGSDKAEIKNDRAEHYNSAFMVDPLGKITGEYSKRHLVPFGEYIPLQEAVPFVKKVVQRYGFEGFKSGKLIEPLEFNGIKVGPIICFDGFFPGISREHAKKGAKILAHLSYETWYGDSPASAIVFTNVLMRAVENRVYILRSVASGISGIINDRGVILFSTKLYEKTAFVRELRISEDKSKSFYTLYGDWFAWMLLLLFCTAAAVKLKKQ